MESDGVGLVVKFQDGLGSQWRVKMKGWNMEQRFVCIRVGGCRGFGVMGDHS